MRRSLAPLALACLVTSALPARAAMGPAERLSDAPGGVQGNHYSFSPGVSADGRYVSFESFATNLDPRYPNSVNGPMRVFVRDRVTGVTQQVSVDSNERNGDGYSANAEISDDGRYVVFDSDGQLRLGHTIASHQVYRRDRVTGTTDIVSVNDAGEHADHGYYALMGHPQMSADGRFVIWTDEAENLVPNDTNGNDWAGVMKGFDCFLRDMVAGTTIRASVTSTGGQIEGEEYGDVGQSFCTAISPSGRYVSFQSYEQVVPDAPRGQTRTYVFDRLTGTSSLPHRGKDVFITSFSADDTKWLLQGPADQLYPGSTSKVSVHAILDRTTGAVTPVQTSILFGGAPRSSSYSGDISADGTKVTYSSFADDLVLGDVDLCEDIYLFDVTTGETTLVSEGLATAAVMAGDAAEPQISADGTYVAWFTYDNTETVPDANFASDVMGRSVA